MKKIYIFSAIVLMFFIGFSQNEIDALRFSQIFWEGSGRSLAMGSSFSALGIDPLEMSINPAGIGLYKKSEINLDMSIHSSMVSSSYAGNSVNDNKTAFKFLNFGVILNFKNDVDNKTGIIIGVGYNRLNNFSKHFMISGINEKGSMIDFFTYQAQGIPPESLDPFSTWLAFDTYLIDTISPVEYTNPLWAVSNNNPIYGEQQTLSADISGGMGEWNFAIAYDYEDLFSVGASVNFVSGYYNFLSTYSEDNYKDPTELKSFSLNTYNDVDISGINFKIGAVFLPTKNIRLAMAFHSPTVLGLTDKYQTSIESHWKTPDANGIYDYSSASPNNIFDYTINTPFRAIGGLGIILAKHLSFNAEYEFADYSSIRMHSADYSFIEENTAIQNNFKATNNFRAGLEFRQNIYYLRAGFSYYDSPYKKSLNLVNSARTFITGGIGIKTKNFYFNFAIKNEIWSETYHLYSGYTDEPIPQLNFNNFNFIFGGGVRF